MSTKRAVIVVPVYKAALASGEKLSLLRCREVLAAYSIVFVGAHSLDFLPYRALCPEATVTTFDDAYFASLEGYSALLVNPDFYRAFLDFEYLLVYQLDAWVFQDQMEYWCAQDYDYIGAPWLGDDGDWIGVGNGGFSLRRVAACLGVLTSRHREDPDEYWEFVRSRVSNRSALAVRYHRKILKHLGIGTEVQHFLRTFVRAGTPEDLFWGYHAVRYSPSFRVAPINEAVLFSVEAGLERTIDYFTSRPPFGCHREWFIEMLSRYRSAAAQPKSDYEALVWRLAQLSGDRRL